MGALSFGASEIDRVTAILQGIIAEEVLPRFRRMAAHEVVAKPNERDPHDVVSVVDHAVEWRLGPVLGSLLPGSIVVGEEAASVRPSIVDALKTASPVWLVDPIDGTKNFVRGDEAFGVMIALVHGGRTRVAWIALPAQGHMFIAEEGAGTYRDGQRLRVPDRAEESVPHGSVARTYLPESVRQVVDGWSDGRFCPRPLEGCAACEYTAVAQGRKDFVVYHRLLPWDHAAPALVLGEAGGVVIHSDGRSYTPSSTDQPTVVAGSPRVAERVRAWLNRDDHLETRTPS